MNELFCELGGSAASCISALTLLRALFSALLAVLFLQSAIDKVVDWKGNLGWLTSHFEKSPLAGVVPIMLGTVTVMELGAGALSAVGAVALLTTGSRVIGVLGALASAATLLALFFGQRLAKDYPGAEVLANYFGVVLVGGYLYLI